MAEGMGWVRNGRVCVRPTKNKSSLTPRHNDSAWPGPPGWGGSLVPVALGLNHEPKAASSPRTSMLGKGKLGATGELGATHELGLFRPLRSRGGDTPPSLLPSTHLLIPEGYTGCSSATQLGCAGRQQTLPGRRPGPGAQAGSSAEAEAGVPLRSQAGGFPGLPSPQSVYPILLGSLSRARQT